MHRVRGSNVVSCPDSSTEVHCVVDGQAIATNPNFWFGSSAVRVAADGSAGEKLTTSPAPPAIRRWVLDGHARPGVRSALVSDTARSTRVKRTL